MIANAQTGANVLTGIEKAAILLVVLGDQTSSSIVKHLSEDEVETVSREVARLKKVSPEDDEAGQAEFYQLTSAREYVARGGVDYAKSMLIKAFGPEASKSLIIRLVSGLGSEGFDQH